MANHSKLHILISILIIVATNLAKILKVDAHGTMIDPVSRNSLWRIDSEAPVNYNDIELFCGGIGVS